MKVSKAAYIAKNKAKNAPGGSKESEQVRETAEDYLNWYMNRTQFDILDKMDELEDEIDQDCSWT